MPVVASHQDPERNRTTALHESVTDVAPNVGGLLQEIEELRHQRMDVDNDNEPAPENSPECANNPDHLAVGNTNHLT